MKSIKRLFISMIVISLIACDSAEVWYENGIFAAGNGHPHEAITDYTKAISLDPNYADAYLSRGIAHNYLKHYQRAVEDYTKTISLEPNKPYAYDNRGFTYKALGYIQQAKKDWQKACELGLKDSCSR